VHVRILRGFRVPPLVSARPGAATALPWPSAMQPIARLSSQRNYADYQRPRVLAEQRKRVSLKPGRHNDRVGIMYIFTQLPCEDTGTLAFTSALATSGRSLRGRRPALRRSGPSLAFAHKRVRGRAPIRRSGSPGLRRQTLDAARRLAGSGFGDEHVSDEAGPHNRISPRADSSGWLALWRPSASPRSAGVSRSPDGQQAAAAVKAEDSIASGIRDAVGESRKPPGDVRRSRFAHATRISLILARDVQRAAWGQTPAPRRRRAFITLQGMRPDSSLPCIALVVARYRTCWTDPRAQKKREAGAPFPRAPSQVAGARGEWRAG
jgi:hypothetical protein